VIRVAATGFRRRPTAASAPIKAASASALELRFVLRWPTVQVQLPSMSSAPGFGSTVALRAGIGLGALPASGSPGCCQHAASSVSPSQSLSSPSQTSGAGSSSAAHSIVPLAHCCTPFAQTPGVPVSHSAGEKLESGWHAPNASQPQLSLQLRVWMPQSPQACCSVAPGAHAPSPPQLPQLPQPQLALQERFRVPQLPQACSSLSPAIHVPSPLHVLHAPHLQVEPHVRFCSPHLPQDCVCV
jgi:hypothetical protein